MSHGSRRRIAAAQSGINQFLGHRVISCELRENVLSKNIGARIADVTDYYIISKGSHGGEGGAHAAQ